MGARYKHSSICLDEQAEMKTKCFPSWKNISLRVWNNWTSVWGNWIREVRAKGRERRETEDNTNYRSSSLRALPVISAKKHDEKGLLLVLSRRIPVRRARACLSFSPREIMTNGILLSSSLEALPFFVLTCASCSIRARAQRTGSSSCPIDNNSCSSCLLFQDRQIWIPNFSSVIKIQSCGCAIIWAGAQVPCNIFTTVVIHYVRISILYTI